MHIHILGICGTFMAGIARLAAEQGHRVTGSDANVYPPMSDQLRSLGVDLHEGYHPRNLAPAPDRVVVGNALSRGNPEVEHLLDAGLPYTSGPAWLAEHVLPGRWVIALAGTHGKTTTTGMVAWILERAGLAPGFLVGGVPENFGVSARLGRAPFFVLEADEYDTAFFDKRSKFVHYRPRTCVLNNLEFDHADIFPDVAAIERQFHHLVRTVPRTGLIIRHAGDPHLDNVLELGCWTPVEDFAGPDARWDAELEEVDGSRFRVRLDGRTVGEVRWNLIGRHNVDNALAAVAAARHAGVAPGLACEALATFRNARRRLEVRGSVAGITVYDDFAHHPTAIATTLAGLRDRVGEARILAILEPRSNTMRLGVHRHTLAPALAAADAVWIHRPAGLDWDLEAVARSIGERARVCDDTAAIIREVTARAKAGDHLLVMSNGAFDDLHNRLLRALAERHA